MLSPQPAEEREKRFSAGCGPSVRQRQNISGKFHFFVADFWRCHA